MSQAHIRESGHYVVNVQILRFFAAFLVVFAHAHAEVLNVAARSSGTFGGIGLLDWGLGVDIFFVISGFIMYYMMHDRFGRPGAPVDFLRRRLVRIVPLYWIFTTLMLVSILAAGSLINNNGLDIRHIVASYAFIPFPRADGELFPLLSLGWTLNYEMLFYAVFALALCLRRPVGIVVMLVLFAVLCLGAMLVPDQVWPLKFWGNGIIGEFLLGIGLAALYLKGFRLPLGVVVVMIAAGLALAIWLYQISAYEHVTRLITGGLPAILVTAAVVLGPSARNGRVTRVFALGGDASYALYLSHPFALKVFGVIGVMLGLPLPGIFIGGIIASVIASTAVHLLLEKPMGAWLSRRTRPRAPVQDACATAGINER
ncbi:acyltransferase family protein [Neorhizobium sp. NPDC001467]|uniref:acyltransferase family protein n=1 Tax=Neorhizobium sp. NPDC001467 TaxID=3390595 RepID=UPI003D0182AD